MNLNTLSETRKADRAKMAKALAEAMIAAGATVEVKPCSYEPKRIDVNITAPGGATIHVDFDGGSTQPGVHVATWNTPQCVFLSPGVIGDVNPHHFGKATRVERGLVNLIARLDADVRRFASGDGYLSHDDPRIVAMAARYAAQGWHDPRIPRPAYSFAA